MSTTERYPASAWQVADSVVWGTVRTPHDDPELQQVVARVPAIAAADEITTHVLPGGLTNRSYLVGAAGAQYVVRLAGPRATTLGIDRGREHAALRRATTAGIAPELVAFFEPEGHAVTRYLSGAVTLSESDMASEVMLPRLVAVLRNVHALEPIDGRFDPYTDIRRWLQLVEERVPEPPPRLAELIERVAGVEEQRASANVALTLCHNDPYHRNFLDDGSLWLIDWEYAGMGDPLYDLAGIAYLLDNRGRVALLDAYYGSAVQPRLDELEDLTAVFICWNVLWSLLQSTRSVIDYDYLSLAEDLLDRLPAA
jgi:thiamine kinase-like enzyme